MTAYLYSTSATGREPKSVCFCNRWTVWTKVFNDPLKKKGNRKSVKLKCQIIRLLMSRLLITREASKISLCLLSNWPCVHAVHVQSMCCTKCQIYSPLTRLVLLVFAKVNYLPLTWKFKTESSSTKNRMPGYSFKSIASLEDRFHWKRLYLKSTGISRLKCFNIFVKFIHFT